MQKELEQKLIERWPTWFNTAGDIRHTAMPRGFTNDDGWFDILWRLCGDLEPLVTEMERTGRKQVRRMPTTVQPPLPTSATGNHASYL